MFLKNLTKVAFLAFMMLLFAAAQATNNYNVYYKNLPFEMPKLKAPVFKNNTVSIADVGGVGNGITLNTKAFEKAMDKLSKMGGGKLLVPAGVWFTGPIVLKSNINLHLEKGALILFSSDFDLYPLIETSFEGLDTKRCQSPISGRNLINIAITGEGSINGSGEAWRPLKRSKVTESQWKKVVKSGGVLKTPDYWFPSKSSLLGESISDMNVPRKIVSDTEWLQIKDFLRPVMVSLVSCKNILFQDVLFENSPAWNIHPLMCENLIIDHVFVRNPGFSQNGDGIDVESCKNTLIVNSTFDVGDDAICIKSGKDEDGRRRAIPTENLIVDNCKVFQGHGGFVVGSEMSGGVRNISVRNCQFLGTDVGLRFKSNRGRGGIVENIFISDIYMFDIVTDSFLFDLYYGGKSASEAAEDGDQTPIETTLTLVTEETPVFRNIYVKNIVSRNANRAMYFNGLPEMNITNINVENAYFSSKYGAEISESDGIKFKNITVMPESGAPLILNNVRNFDLKEFKYPENSSEIVKVLGKCEHINLPTFLPLLAEQKLYAKMAESEMKRNPKSWMIDFAKTLKWDYCNGLELQAFYNVWKKTNDSRYLNYMKSYTDTIINEDGKIFGYKKYDYNIDKVNPGKFLFLLYSTTHEPKLKFAIDSLYSQMTTHPRTLDGGFWHKKIYPHQMWLDGLYMASPFLAEYAYRYNKPELYDDVANQLLTMAKHSYDAKTGLYYHAWDESKTQRWANPATGISPNFWSRSMGWYMMAMVDVLDFIPVDHPKRAEIIDILKGLTDSLLKYRDPSSGMWYQVTDKVGAKGNYVESSGSVMFIYSIVKGAQKEYLPKSYLNTGITLYNQFVKRFIKNNNDGTISVTDCCAVAGLGGEKNYRDGSYEYYLSEPTRDNDPKTVAPFMMVSVMLDK